MYFGRCKRCIATLKTKQLSEYNKAIRMTFTKIYSISLLELGDCIPDYNQRLPNHEYHFIVLFLNSKRKK